MKLTDRLANLALGTVWNSLFRIGYSPESMRRNLNAVGASTGALKIMHPRASFEPVEIGDRKAEWISASPDYEKTILYLHGGGYFMGSIRGYRSSAVFLSKVCEAKILLLDYRLAPEHPFPAALEDAVAAYKYILARQPAA